MLCQALIMSRSIGEVIVDDARDLDRRLSFSSRGQIIHIDRRRR